MSLKTAIKTVLLIIGFFVFSYFIFQQKDKKMTEMIIYDGPVAEMEDVRIIYSDSARLKVTVKAPKQLEHQNGDKEFPDGIFVVFYNEKEEVSSNLKADYGIVRKEDNTYFVRGAVEVKDMTGAKKLKSEELNWNPNAPKNERLYTEKFVIIETETEVLRGEGLKADQNFDNYEILKPHGKFILESE